MWLYVCDYVCDGIIMTPYDNTMIVRSAWKWIKWWIIRNSNSNGGMVHQIWGTRSTDVVGNNELFELLFKFASFKVTAKPSPLAVTFVLERKTFEDWRIWFGINLRLGIIPPFLADLGFFGVFWVNRHCMWVNSSASSASSRSAYLSAEACAGHLLSQQRQQPGLRNGPARSLIFSNCGSVIRTCHQVSQGLSVTSAAVAASHCWKMTKNLPLRWCDRDQYEQTSVVESDWLLRPQHAIANGSKTSELPARGWSGRWRSAWGPEWDREWGSYGIIMDNSNRGSCGGLYGQWAEFRCNQSILLLSTDVHCIYSDPNQQILTLLSRSVACSQHGPVSKRQAWYIIYTDVRTRNILIMHGCMDVWMYGCMDVWMYGCMYVCM